MPAAQQPRRRRRGTSAPSGATSDSASRHRIVTTCIAREIASAAGTPKRAGIDRRPCARSKSRSWQAYSTSNPPTHVPIASASSHGSHPPRPPTASQPPTGATAIARPRNSCVHVVKRLASEYQNTIASATGDSSEAERVQTPGGEHEDDRRDDDEHDRLGRASSRRAAARDSPCAGLSASNRASTRRLNPIAALRAATIATRIHADRAPRDGGVLRRQQRAGQRKRQREHRVAEPDERQVDGQALQH